MPFPASVIGLEPESFIELFDLDQWDLSNPAETRYFANYGGIVFRGNSYQAVPLDSDGFDITTQGPTPQPTISISLVQRPLSDFINTLKTDGYRLEGARITRRLTQRRFLDDGVEAGAAVREASAEVFFIEQLSVQNREIAAFKLRTAFETEGVQLPSRLAARNCVWEYRGTGCRYTGGGFTANNEPTANPALDICAHTLTACEIRHQSSTGLDAPELPYGGFPGLSQY